MPKFVAWFSEIHKNDVALVGGKGANLGEMTNAGFPVPNGFVVTSHAYYEFIKENKLDIKIKHLLSSAKFDNSTALDKLSKQVKKLVTDGKLSDELIKQIVTAYNKLGGALEYPLVAVRSSATAEDLANASFAGQQETYLNVKGDAVLLEKIKQGWASLFDARAIFYRHQQHYDHILVGIALVVQKMVESTQSGIMFTIDPVTNDKSKIVIESIYGLGELIVQGEENPDHYEVSKSDFSIMSKKFSLQNKKMVKAGVDNKIVKLSKSEGSKQKISDAQIGTLAHLGEKLEKHYYFPQDIEWAIEGSNVFIVQTRSVTTTHTTNDVVLVDKVLASDVILKGDPASPGIAA